jgi:hypothetical protein
MKTKFVKLSQAAAGAVVEGLSAAEIANVAGQVGGAGVQGPSPVAKFLGEAGEEAKKPQDVPFENFKGVSLEIETLKDDYESNGFSPEEFDSYLPDYFNLERTGRKVPENPKAKIIPPTKMVELMKMAKETAFAANMELKSVFNAIIDLVIKNVNFNLVKDVIPAAAKLEAKARGMGIFQSLLNAIHGDVTGSTLLMFMLPEEDMRTYNSILARALGHKLSAAEEIRKSTDITKLTLQKATEELGLVRGIKVGLESQSINAIEENFTKQLTGLIRDVPVVRELMSLARQTMMLYHVYSNIKDQFLGSVAPSTVPARTTASVEKESKFVRLAQAKPIQFPTRTPTTNPAQTPMGRPTNEQNLNTILTRQNTPPSPPTNTLVKQLLEMNKSIIDGNSGVFARLKAAIPGTISAVPASYAALLDTARYWYDQFTTTGSETALYDPNDIKELVQGLTNNSKESEKFYILSENLKKAAENYDKRKASLYGGGDEGAGKLTTDVMEFGQAKKVPFNTVSQNLQRLNEFKTSVENCIQLATELQAQFAIVRTLPPPANLSAQQRANLLRNADNKLFGYKSQLEKWKAEKVKVVSELATIKQTTKQKEIRFFGGSEIGKKLKMLADRGFGGYGMMGGVAQLNTLMAPLIQEQKDKIASITNEMSSATSPEDQRAFQGQLQLAKNELQELLAEGPNMLLQALEGKFDDSKWSNAFASVSNSKFIKTSKFNKEADERLEDYYNEEMDYSPYGTALEHPLENEGVLTEDIKPHKKSRYKKHKFQI